MTDTQWKRTAARLEARTGLRCAQCGVELEPARSSARYCSPRCRMAHHRGGLSVRQYGLSRADMAIWDKIRKRYADGKAHKIAPMAKKVGITVEHATRLLDHVARWNAKYSDQ